MYVLHLSVDCQGCFCVRLVWRVNYMIDLQREYFLLVISRCTPPVGAFRSGISGRFGRFRKIEITTAK
jgi:hypothetical protein